MAIRRWRVHPDVQVPVNGEWLDVVSREALVNGILDGVAMLDRSGGILTVVVGRAPTELEGEMMTTGAVIEHKNRTDATPQPESPSSVPVHAAGVAGSVADPFASDEVAEPEQAIEIPVEDDNPDGMDYSALDEEDLSDIPLHAR